MKKLYRSKQWSDFREEVIELDGGACVRCKRTREDGAVLQVHHKAYLSGKAPWEYPLQLCETLCKRCHAEEHGEIRPDTGWEYVGQDDLGGLYGTCDRCGTDIKGKTVYSTLEAAKTRAFSFIDSGEADDFFARKA